MKTNFYLRFLALILVVSIVLPACGCSGNPKEPTPVAETIGAASITGEYALGDEDPTITVELQNTKAVENPSVEMFTLTGLFSALEITAVSQSDATVTLSTKGTIPFSTPLCGGVDIAPGALSSGKALYAVCDILYRGASIQQDSFAFSASKLTFSLVALNDSFTFAVGDVIKSGELAFTVDSVASNGSAVTLSVPCEAQDLDAAIDLINGMELSVPSDKTASKTTYSAAVLANKASFGATVEAIVKTELDNTYKATALLFVKDGDWAGTLNSDDVTFGGDFTNAEVSSLVLDQGAYRLEFTFVKEDLNLESSSLYGSVTVPKEKIQNAWRTLLPESTAELNYSEPGVKLDGYKEIIALVPAETGIFDKISTLGGYASSAAGVASGIYTVLGMVGIVENTNAKIDHVRELVKEVQQSIVALDEKLDKLGATLTSGTVETMNAVQYNTYIIASGNWDQFISAYVIPLQNKLSQFEMAYNDYMLKYVMNAHTSSGAITVWFDTNGDVTLPHPANNTNTTKYSVEGVPLTKTEVCHLPMELIGVQAKVMQNGGRLYDGYWEDIVAEIGENQLANVAKEEYLDSVQMNASLYALQTVGSVEILNAYTNFCNAIIGDGASGGLKPLDNYLTMLSMYYNFYIESANDIETTLSWLYSVLAEGSFVATFAYNFTPSAKKGLINECYDKTVKKLTEASEEKDPLYSYLGNKTLTARQIVHYPGNELTGLYYTHENDLYFDKYSKKETSNFVHPESLRPGNYMDEILVNLMIKRYEHLCKTNVTNSPTFRDYMISLGVIDRSMLYDENGNVKDAQIIGSPITIEDIPADNSLEMEITNVRTSTWYKEGDVITIGSQGKVDKKYYKMLTRRRANTIDFDGNSTTAHTLIGYADYYEEHWYWFTFENWECIELYDGLMLVFTLK